MTKPGTDLERIISIIEKSISDDSRVEHNVFLPVLTSTEGRKAQCDIVIRSGNYLRETLTIVEVQDRKSKITINTFRGWLSKCEEVGAQHLVCVSRKDFPSSVKELVRQSGSKVFLVTLKETLPENIPLNFIKFIIDYHDIDVVSVLKLNVTVDVDHISKYGLTKAKLNLNDRVFSFDGIKVFSLWEICTDVVDKKLEGCKEKSGGIEGISWDLIGDDKFYFLCRGNFIRIGIDIIFEWESDYINIPTTIASYEQDKHGVLAWVFEAEHSSQKRGKFSIKIPVIKYDCDGIRIPEIVVNSDFDYKMWTKVVAEDRD